MTKNLTLTIALNQTKHRLIDISLELFATRTESRLDELAKNHPMFIGALQTIAILSTMRDAMAWEPDDMVFEDAVPVAVLVTALRHFRKFSMENLLELADGNPRLVVGVIQAVALASELIDELATKANALADEEEAQGLKKAV